MSPTGPSLRFTPDARVDKTPVDAALLHLYPGLDPRDPKPLPIGQKHRVGLSKFADLQARAVLAKSTALQSAFLAAQPDPASRVAPSGPAPGADLVRIAQGIEDLQESAETWEYVLPKQAPGLAVQAVPQDPGLDGNTRAISTCTAVKSTVGHQAPHIIPCHSNAPFCSNLYFHNS